MDKQDKILGKLEEMNSRISSIDNRVSSMGARLIEQTGVQDKIIGKLVDMEDYMSEHLATKEELRGIESRLTDQVEGFVKLHTALNHEHYALCSKVDRIDKRVVGLEKTGRVASGL